jgi:urease accessory protein
VVLGRAGQRGGCYHGELAVELDGAPLLAHTLLLDGADPALAGPAGTGGARVVGMLTVVGEGSEGPPEGAGEEPGLRWGCSALDGPGRLLLALGDSPPAVSALLDRSAAASKRSSELLANGRPTEQVLAPGSRSGHRSCNAVVTPPSY